MSRLGIRGLFQIAGGLAALAILVVTVRDAFRELGAGDVFLDARRALLATAMLALTFLGAIFLWSRLLRSFGSHVAYSGALELWSFSNLGRYLPGKVWQVVGVMMVARDVGVRPASAAAVAFVSIAFQIATGAVVALPLLSALPSTWSPVSGVVIALSVGVLLPLLFPGWIPGLLRRLPRTLGFTGAATPSRATVLGWILAFASLWIAQGVSFAVLASAFARVPLSLVPAHVGTWALAYVVGLVAFFAPGGIGVREGVLAPLLSAVGPADLPAHVVAVASRLWSIAAELTILALALATRWRSRIRR